MLKENLLIECDSYYLYFNQNVTNSMCIYRTKRK